MKEEIIKPIEKKSERTKKTLQKAFLKLLSTMKLEDISITYLCESAGINRSTFYTYYLNFNDLLEQIGTVYSEKITAELNKAKENFSNREAYLYPFLKLIYENGDFFKAYYENTNVFGYCDGLKEILKKCISGYIIKSLGLKGSEFDLALSFYEAGVYSLISTWAKKGYKEAPEQIADILTVVINNSKKK